MDGSFLCQGIRKLGSVLADHLSSPGVATRIKRLLRQAPGGTP